ncbi:hypothetical protein HS1genome_0567 [Sulfodiicoccus acidiphilus]|uniref:Major facilitator superfamily (MFS) profile domain-containing protein n=1 Tax=Sulfodiicoccus acidiphilus TaxID=1670455 RepID=A0A348B1X6_9CREN|nr:hypothetical protein [Sulfodiicoccus acidiphilus]BBD72178.1 hypothetical protein HS1genome_0567 [Sulfodiicoccus acidiphilus]GGT94431.1 hypothetical protein GCM10007116_10030 [Sulfodiicoccus acidiphilus]
MMADRLGAMSMTFLFPLIISRAWMIPTVVGLAVLSFAVVLVTTRLPEPNQVSLGFGLHRIS